MKILEYDFQDEFDNDELIERFSSFHDSFIRKIDVKYRHLGQVTIVTIVLSAREAQSADNEEWFDVAIEIGNATEFRFCESPKESYQVLSEGLKVARYYESIFIDFGHFDELPKDPNEWRSSRFFVIGSTVKWSVSNYTD